MTAGTGPDHTANGRDDDHNTPSHGVAATTPPPPPLANDGAMATADNEDSNDHGGAAFLQPRPRHPKSPAHSAQIRVQNRRREYLERNPGYFGEREHESADPVLYDTLIRRFQSPEEREREGRAKGYSRTLEMDIMRGEARVDRAERAAACWEGRRQEAVKNSAGDEEDGNVSDSAMMPPPPLPEGRRSGGSTGRTESEGGHDGPLDRDALATMRTQEDEDEEFVAGAIAAMSSTAAAVGASEDGRRQENNNHNPYVPVGQASSSVAVSTVPRAAAESREEGRTRWREFLRRRFVLGKDDDFDYSKVDEDDELDALERREEEERWFEDEEPEWAAEDGEEENKKVERMLEGETGIQDY